MMPSIFTIVPYRPSSDLNYDASRANSDDEKLIAEVVALRRSAYLARHGADVYQENYQWYSATEGYMIRKDIAAIRSAFPNGFSKDSMADAEIMTLDNRIQDILLQAVRAEIEARCQDSPDFTWRINRDIFEGSGP